MYDERIAGSRADALGPRLQRLDLSGVGVGWGGLWGLVRRAGVCRPGVIQAWVSAFIYLSIYLPIYLLLSTCSLVLITSRGVVRPAAKAPESAPG